MSGWFSPRAVIYGMPLAHLTWCLLPLGLSAPSGPCWPGHFCTSQARVPDPVGDGTGGLCPAGHFCPPGSPEPQPCPSGTFLPQSGMGSRNSCLPCPAGKFCQGEGLAAVSGVYCMHPTSSFSPNLDIFLCFLVPNLTLKLFSCRTVSGWVFL